MVDVLFFEEGEDASRRGLTRLAGQDGSNPDALAISINSAELPIEFDIDEHRTHGCDRGCPNPVAGLQVVGQLRERQRRRDLGTAGEDRRGGHGDEGAKHEHLDRPSHAFSPCADYFFAGAEQ